MVENLVFDGGGFVYGGFGVRWVWCVGVICR